MTGTTELQMIALRRKFLALHDLARDAGDTLEATRKAQLSAQFLAWLKQQGINGGDNPKPRVTKEMQK